MIFSLSITSLRMNMFSHAAIECRSALPLNLAVASAAAIAFLVTGA